MTRESRVFALSAVVLFSATVRNALAGDLNPPVGPVAPSHKTLTEVEPRIAVTAANTPGDADSLFKITQPGSYYLIGNITGVSAKHGIEIAASGVNLDLMGFDLVGVAGSLDGVSATVSGLTDITVVNGSVRNWGDKGLDMQNLGAINCRVVGLRASGNTGTGIFTTNNCTVTSCSAHLNGGNGIYAGFGSSVSNCVASGNGGNGFSINAATAITNCSAYSNAVNGINASSGCSITNCSAYQNTGDGINASGGAAVSNCSALSNSGNGIRTVTGGVVTDCAVYLNALDGIVCANACLIRDNVCASNGNGPGSGAGIFATASDNRIEGNTCTLADRGIFLPAAGNIIIRNTCAGNTTNWDIAANNVYGPIIDRTAPASPAVLGNSAATTLGTTDPNANFSY